MRKTITVDISAKGEVSVDLNGFQGQGCDQVMKDFRGDNPVKVSRNKPEREYATNPLQQGTQQKQ